MSAGVTPRETVFIAMRSLHAGMLYLDGEASIAHAEIRWQRFDIVAINGLYTIPEPQDTLLVIPTNAARQQIKNLHK